MDNGCGFVPSTDLAAVQAGWVDREGQCYPVRYSDHAKAAWQLLGARGIAEEDRDDPEEDALRLGWVKLHNFDHHYSASHMLTMTAKQKDVVEEWLLCHGADPEVEIIRRRFREKFRF